MVYSENKLFRTLDRKTYTLTSDYSDTVIVYPNPNPTVPINLLVIFVSFSQSV